MKIIIDEDAVEARQEEINRTIAALKKEADDLTVMLRLARQFQKPGDDGAEESEGNRLGPARPDGIPTLYLMAYEVIRDAELRGQDGLSAVGVVEEIGRRYWPGVRGPQVHPSLYGFVKAGRLFKTDDGLFHTVQKNEAPAEQSESASQVTGEGSQPSLNMD